LGGGGGTGTLREVLGEWGVPIDVHMPCVPVVKPIFQLLWERAWSSLLFMSQQRGWFILDRKLPAGFAVQPPEFCNLDTAHGVDLNRQWIDNHIAFLREWAPAILQDSPADRFALEGMRSNG